MPDSSHRQGLSLWRVVASYAISAGGFLMLGVVGGWITTGEPFAGLALPVLPVVSVLFYLRLAETSDLLNTSMAVSMAITFVLVCLLGLCGIVLSVLQSGRQAWFVYGHICLAA
jgi:hypothetical protein